MGLSCLPNSPWETILPSRTMLNFPDATSKLEQRWYHRINLASTPELSATNWFSTTVIGPSIVHTVSKKPFSSTVFISMLGMTARPHSFGVRNTGHLATRPCTQGCWASRWRAETGTSWGGSTWSLGSSQGYCRWCSFASSKECFRGQIPGPSSLPLKKKWAPILTFIS